MPNKTVKRIHRVTIKRMIDESPDTIWLGEYSNRPTSDYSIDRKHDLDCIANNGGVSVFDKEPHLLYECGICDCLHPWLWNGDCRDDNVRYGDSGEYAAKHGIKDTDVHVVSWEDHQQVDDGCTCGGRGDMERNEYRYFNPSFNYVDKNGKRLPENTDEDVRKYVRQDYERMESLNRGDWCFLGVEAVAVYSVGGTPATLQTVTSGGLWGIESDGNGDDMKEIESEQLSELHEQLHAIGFSKRAISAAFKNVQREDAQY